MVSVLVQVKPLEERWTSETFILLPGRVRRAAAYGSAKGALLMKPEHQISIWCSQR
jgi:hypothetical protein